MTTPLPPADLEERRPLVSIAVVPCMIHIIVKDWYALNWYARVFVQIEGVYNIG